MHVLGEQRLDGPYGGQNWKVAVVSLRDGQERVWRVQLVDIPAVPFLPSPLRDRAASDQGPRHLPVTYGVVATRRPPNGRQPTNTACTATSVAPGTQRATLALTDSDVALLTERDRGGVRQVRPLPPRGPGTGGLRREQAPVPQWQATTHYPGNLRRYSELAPTKTADGQQRAGLRERVLGSDKTQSSHVLYSISGGSFPSGVYA